MPTPADINSLFQAAQSSGALSAASMQALTIADIGAMIQAGLGTPGTSVRQCSGGSGRPSPPPCSGGEYYADHSIAAGYRFL